jgi:hypothetical protein
MPADFCLGCGTEHHWLACPEVSQSVFPYDPEWEGEESPPPMVANYSLWGFSTADPAWRPTRLSVEDIAKIRESGILDVVGPPWDPATPE